MIRIRTFIANWIGLEENAEELNEVEPRPDHQIMDKMLVDYYISSAAYENQHRREDAKTSSRNHHQSSVHLGAMRRKIVMLSKVLLSHRRVKAQGMLDQKQRLVRVIKRVTYDYVNQLLGTI